MNRVIGGKYDSMWINFNRSTLFALKRKGPIELIKKACQENL